MTVAARRVLADCEVVLEMLDDERDEQRWRVLWVGALALLRAVGHVLQKVDGQTPRARAAIDAAYQNWKSRQPEHRIFRDFIEKQRNNILKEYRMNVLDSAQVPVVVHSDVGSITDETLFILDENLFRPVTEGFGADEDARDMYREAIGWWETELSRLEAVLASSDR